MLGIFKGLLPDIKSFLSNDKKKHEQVFLNIDALKDELSGSDKYTFDFGVEEESLPKIQLFHDTVHIRASDARKLMGEEPKEEESKKEGFEYKVAGSDTLFGLSLRYNVSLQSIKKMNSISTDTLYPGQVFFPENNERA